ncbi:hypothetical protein SDC9_165457 [bioreactor metagenome]|uniref:Uncharacterized protein n=1 Tax=bioreactor metagenome TaxID=1076179 RepID=A0A645FWW9_9ZZZZ
MFDAIISNKVVFWLLFIHNACGEFVYLFLISTGQKDRTSLSHSCCNVVNPVLLFIVSCQFMLLNYVVTIFLY